MIEAVELEHGAVRRPRDPGGVLLISCYELGRQPLGLASPVAFLERAGFQPAVLDVAVEALDEARVRAARLVAISVPMHTALRLGVHVARRVRALNPECHLCFHGLYAPLHAPLLAAAGADSILGGECEEELVALAQDLDRSPPRARAARVQTTLRRLDFVPPHRDALLPLARYVHLKHAGKHWLAGAEEASRGCLHHCRHCPIPAVYGGRLFPVPETVVLADVRMPRMTGYEACKHLKANPVTANIPVIFLTSYSDEATVRRAAETAPYGFLTKPFNVEELFARIETRLAEQPPAPAAHIAHPLTAPAGGTPAVTAVSWDRPGLLVGAPENLRQLYGLLDQVAPSRCTVFISGPSGVGWHDWFGAALMVLRDLSEGS